MVSERSLYTYVNNGLLSARNMDMPRTVRMRPRKGKKKTMKVDKSCRIHRTFEDYQKFMQEHPLYPVRQLDSVEGVSEFSNPGAIEFDRQGNRRTRMFYCNPSAPYQKGNCENNHGMIRHCIPKGTDLGQYTQEQINLMMSHINSYARPNLGNKSPYEVFTFQYGENILPALGLKRIPADEIILTPKLFK